MKASIWNFCVLLTSVIPRRVRVQFCRLLFAASAKGDVSSASKDLLMLDDDLNWYINEVAVRYEGGKHPKHRLTKYHEYFTARLSDGELVLDVGCGYGALANSMSCIGAMVCGVDINERSIR